MKLPAFQFYPGDWRKDPAVQSLSYNDRGIWFEILCLMHESEDRGKLLLNGKPMPDEALARLLGLDKQNLTKTITTLLTFGVASRDSESGALISRRMVRDEGLRKIRREAGKLGGNPALVKQKTTTQDKVDSTPSVSSSSSSSKREERKHTREDSLIEGYKAKLEDAGIAVPTPKRSKFPPGIPEKMQTAAMLEALRIWQEHLIDRNVTPPSRPQWHSTGLKLESVGERRGLQVIDFSLAKGAKNLIWDAPDNHALTVLKHVGANVPQKQDGEPPGWREWVRDRYPDAKLTQWKDLIADVKQEFADATPHLKWRGLRWSAEQ